MHAVDGLAAVIWSTCCRLGNESSVPWRLRVNLPVQAVPFDLMGTVARAVGMDAKRGVYRFLELCYMVLVLVVRLQKMYFFLLSSLQGHVKTKWRCLLA